MRGASRRREEGAHAGGAVGADLHHRVPAPAGSSLASLRLAAAAAQQLLAVSCTPEPVFRRTVLLQERPVPRLTHRTAAPAQPRAGELRHRSGTSTRAGSAPGWTEELFICPDKPHRAAHGSWGQEAERRGERQELLLCQPTAPRLPPCLPSQDQSPASLEQLLGPAEPPRSAD